MFHVGIIADGNGRWAEMRGLSRLEGHKAGANNVENIVNYLQPLGVTHVTLYGFSTENWNRNLVEVDGLFSIMTDVLNDGYVSRALSRGIRLHQFGRTDRLPWNLLSRIRVGLEATSKSESMHVALCLDYGGRDELLRAKGDINVLDSACFPDLDLVIRTGGEQRISNFMLWKIAYSELYFTDTLFPDLDDVEIKSALDWYKGRKRTYGRNLAGNSTREATQ